MPVPIGNMWLKPNGNLSPHLWHAAKVVLPEGSSAIQASVPFAVAETRSKKFTYLDTLGRPVVTLHKANVVPDHSEAFSVTYRLSSLQLLQVS